MENKNKETENANTETENTNEVESNSDTIEAFNEEREFVLKTDTMTGFAIELLFTDIIEKIKEEEPVLVGQYALFGAAEGILRGAKLLLAAAPSNPELANAVMNIANVISNVGFKISSEVVENSKNLERENTLLNSAEIDDIMKAISNIDVSLPEELK